MEGKPDGQAFLDFLRGKLEEAERGGSTGRDPVPSADSEDQPEPVLHEMERLLERLLRKRGYATD